MDNALDTLFLPLENGNLDLPPDAALLFLNAQYHPALDRFERNNLILCQSFKPYAAALQTRGFSVCTECDKTLPPCDAAFVLLPKNMIEARAYAARAAMALRPGGRVLCAASNDAGGGRIKKMLQEFGFENMQDLSKHKARAVWAQKDNINESAVQEALREGAMQNIPDIDFLSMPGVFSWDRADAGSQILLRHMDEDLDGTGADFGCGYGYLSRHMLQKFSGIKKIFCIDADARALQCCEKNLQGLRADIVYLWEDLSQPVKELKNLGWVVMNPPFHEGKKADPAIGISFIRTASASLREGGLLWMVANAALPYEAALQQNFSRVEKKFEGSGFKVFRAVK